MIKGTDTNKVFFSEHLKTNHPNNYNDLIAILSKHNISYELLKGTKDIWCRDYMPIQVKKTRFLQFRYEPTYQKTPKELAERSKPDEVLQANNIIAERHYEINLDGGNVICWDDRVLLTDRIFSENPDYNKTKLVDDLETLFEAEVIVIPQIKSDLTGHIDGMIRLKDRNTLIGNSRGKEYKYWSKGINNILRQHQLDYIDVPFIDHKIKNHPYHAIGCYVNYLEIGNLIVLPRFEVDHATDDDVVTLFNKQFPDRIIESINYNGVGLGGGLLNCSTWTIQS